MNESSSDNSSRSNTDPGAVLWRSGETEHSALAACGIVFLPGSLAGISSVSKLYHRQIERGIHSLIHREPPQSARQTREIDPVLVQCWASVCDAGPTLNQLRVNVPCLLGTELRHGPDSHLRLSVFYSSQYCQTDLSFFFEVQYILVHSICSRDLLIDMFIFFKLNLMLLSMLRSNYME